MRWIIVLFLLSSECGLAAAIAPVSESVLSGRSIALQETSSGFLTDSVVPKPKTEEDFMRQYGTDDTSRALIRYYFFQGKKYRRFTWLPFVFAAPFIAGGSILLGSIDFEKSSAGDDSLPLLAALALIAGSSIAAIVWSITSHMRYRRFRIKLTNALLQYREKGIVKRRISASTLFRVSLIGEPSLLPWKQPKPAPRAREKSGRHHLRN